jgi:hypothetical protein
MTREEGLQIFNFHPTRTQYVPRVAQNSGVVVKGDLVTGHSRHEVQPFIQVITQQIQAFATIEGYSDE